jgi:hypothetical protein
MCLDRAPCHGRQNGRIIAYANTRNADTSQMDGAPFAGDNIAEITSLPHIMNVPLHKSAQTTV